MISKECKARFDYKLIKEILRMKIFHIDNANAHDIMKDSKSSII